MAVENTAAKEVSVTKGKTSFKVDELSLCFTASAWKRNEILADVDGLMSHVH